jgi:hexosaminidase
VYITCPLSHLCCMQSFPLLLRDTADGLPLSRLATAGAFSAGETYTLAELADLVGYADRLGIEIVPEIDVPAHTKLVLIFWLLC